MPPFIALGNMTKSDCTTSRLQMRSEEAMLRKLILCALGLTAVLAVRPTGAADQTAVETELRRDTQALLDAIAPGDVPVWDRLLDPGAIQVDENDTVRDKKQILAELQPLGPGLEGHLDIDDFRVALFGDVAV